MLLGCLKHGYNKGDMPDKVARLIELGADVDARDAKGRTPLILAVLYTGGPEGSMEKIVGLLIRNGADVNAADQHEWTPLSLAHPKRQAGIVELLKAAGAKE